MPSSPPVALTIAGSDNSAGAGAQADLKTFGAFGVYGVTAITCIVAEVPGRVSAIQSVDEKIVREQIRLNFEAYPVAAVKTGLLRSKKIIETVCDTLEEIFGKAGAKRPPLVVDPVMIATSGDPLLDEDAMTVYTGRLFKLATLITPNLDEVGALLGQRVGNVDRMRTAGRELAAKYGTAFLLKGGHLRGSETAVDLLFTGTDVKEFSARFVPDVATHGTGCTYSAAITAGLAKGLLLPLAVAEAKPFVTRVIAEHFVWKRDGNVTAALNHFL